MFVKTNVTEVSHARILLCDLTDENHTSCRYTDSLGRPGIGNRRRRSICRRNSRLRSLRSRLQSNEFDGASTRIDRHLWTKQAVAMAGLLGNSDTHLLDSLGHAFHAQFVVTSVRRIAVTWKFDDNHVLILRKQLQEDKRDHGVNSRYNYKNILNVG